MNKKFSTLVAALFCASSALVVSAQTTALPIQNAGECDVLSISQAKYYQLASSNGQFVLVMEPTTTAGTNYTLKLKNISSSVDLDASLWKIEFTTTQAGTTFTYVNKKTGLPLSVDPSKAVDFSKITTAATGDALTVGGSTSAWSWAGRPPFVQQGSTQALGSQGLTSYFKADSVLTLVTGATLEASSKVNVSIPTFDANGNKTGMSAETATEYNYTTNENVYLVKAHKDIASWKKVQLRVAPVTPAEMTLSAKSLNTLMGTDLNSTSFKLSANKTVSDNAKYGNVFLSNTFKAVTFNDSYPLTDASTGKNNFVEYGVLELQDNSSEYVALQIAEGDNKGKYLVADTSYVDGTAVNLKLPKFAYDKFQVVKDHPVNATVKADYSAYAAKGRKTGAYFFKFNYYPFNDSIAITVKTRQDYKGATAEKVDVAKQATLPAFSYYTCWNETPGINDDQLNLVTLNRLTNVTEITLASEQGPANTRFYLGAASDNRTSEANGLYYITNDKGQYLAVPINEADYNEAKWVTVKASEQNVAHMPAYQWVILKNNEATTLAGKSTLAIVNREFPLVNAGAAQVYKNANATYKYAVAGDLFAAKDSVVFTQIKDNAVLGDSLLGYNNLADKDLIVKTYKFNYLHPYATDKFIGKNAKDSLLSVLNDETAFYLKELPIKNYGYNVTTEVATKIAGLKQLRRSAYVPYVKTAKGDVGIHVNAEDQYYLASITSDAPGTFYFKENNQYKPEGADAARCYYALIDITKGTTVDSTKVGATDDDMAAILKNQVLYETRTSAFAVMESKVPLYRRFNTALEGVASDAADTLRFKEYYRGEYLMDENNAKFQNAGMNYVGIERADKATGLSFIVDTAIVYTTPYGEIKPQYFVYVNKQVKDVTPAIDCDATNHKHTDANGKETTADKCTHATPAKAGFVRAQYMVSFADSLASDKADKLYKFGKYTRVGFVDGLHIGDSLYILTNGFEKKALADLDTAEIKAAYKAAKITDHIIDLKAGRTDKHHNYTWSFRFVNPEKAATATEESMDVAFLIESNKGDANDVAPKMGAWLKSQNGCLVVSETSSTFDNAKTGGDNALIFNVEVGSKKDLATDNENITTSAINVTAGEGNVTIAGAQGKKVVISNVLGQVIANTVITSDNATIAAPAGVVVVAVEGESAVKAMVK